jgi:ribose 5-phosphate isomerase A
MNINSKIAAANAAVEYIENHMVIGVGTGSTVKPFIEALNKRIESEGLELSAAVTSSESRDALHKSVTIIEPALSQIIDITIDGADRASRDFYLIKGGGGALLREKYVSLNSKKNITIIDESKIASPLNGHPLPVEIVTFGYESTLKRLDILGFRGKLRESDGIIFTTEGGNYIYDIEIKEDILNPRSMHASLKAICGVIETGLFLQTSDIIIIGKNDLSVDVWNKGK